MDGGDPLASLINGMTAVRLVAVSFFQFRSSTSDQNLRLNKNFDR